MRRTAVSLAHGSDLSIADQGTMDTTAPRTTRLLLLGRTQWLFLAFSLTAVALLIAWAVFHPALYLAWCERYYLPSIGDRLGFTSGRISVPGRNHDRIGLVTVEPGGLLGRAGFRSGDVPIHQHGGLADLCGALQYAEEGGAPTVTVINVADWRRGGYDARRELSIHPAVPQPDRSRPERQR